MLLDRTDPVVIRREALNRSHIAQMEERIRARVGMIHICNSMNLPILHHALLA